MKTKTFIYVAFALLLIGFITGRIVKKPTYQIPEGMVLVSQRFLDSLTFIANLPPTIIVKDSIIRNTVRIVITNPDPQPDPENPALTIYNDSLVVQDTIDVKIRFKTTGLLFGPIEWTYTPILHFREITIEKPVPYPVIEKVPVNVYKTGYYLSFAAGGNENKFLFGSDLDIVTKNSYIYGLQYRRLGNENIFGVKIGINLNEIFKRN